MGDLTKGGEVNTRTFVLSTWSIFPILRPSTTNSGKKGVRTGEIAEECRLTSIISHSPEFRSAESERGYGIRGWQDLLVIRQEIGGEGGSVNTFECRPPILGEKRGHPSAHPWRKYEGCLGEHKGRAQERGVEESLPPPRLKNFRPPVPCPSVVFV